MDNKTAMEEWREKYLLHLHESESKEQRWAQSEELLRRTLSRVTLVAEGIDQELDGSLATLRQSLRDRAAPEILETELERLAVVIAHYETRDKAGLVVTPAGVLLTLLDSITWPQPLRRQVKTVRAKIRERGYPAELVPLLPECAQLLSHSIGSNRPPEGDAVDSPGFFSKLFGAEPRRSSGVAAAESLATSVALLEQVLTPLMETLVRNKAVNSSIFWERYREQLQAASNHEALLCIADELVVALATELRGAPDDVAHPVERVASRQANELFLNLLDRLGFPLELENKVVALRAILMEEVTPHGWSTVLDGLCDLIVALRRKIQREKQDLEIFLSGLTGSLKELDEKMQGARHDTAVIHRSGQQLSHAVQAEVTELTSSMQRAGDLEQLKMEVSEALGQISKHMESYRFDEERRHQEADTRLAQLNERLQSLEHETATLRGRIREQRDQALRDALTGINNRLAYDERIEQEYGRWKRFREPISLIVWDVDHFKKINDTFGHQAGDKVLMAIAKLFVAQIREADFVARYGGEEFVVLATGASSATALILAEKLRNKIESSQFKHGDVLVPVTVSCGIAEFSEGLSVEVIFAEADRALYHAKQQGRNRCLRVEDLEA